MSPDIGNRIIRAFTTVATLIRRTRRAAVARRDSRARAPLASVRKRLLAPTLLGVAVAVVLTIEGLAGPVSAHAQGAQDPCLVGSWTAEDVTSVPGLYTGTATMTFPSPSGGFAALNVHASKTYLSEGEPLVIPDPPQPTAGEEYSVSSPSTPSASGGSMQWTPIDTTGLYNESDPLSVVPTLPPDYTCTATTLNLGITLDASDAFGRELFLDLGAFTRTGLGPAGLAVATEGGGSGTVTGGSSIDCSNASGPSCSAWVPAGSATLTAGAAPGSAFVGWDGPCSGSGQVCDLSLDPDQVLSVRARFEPVHVLSVAKAGTGDGGVSSLPAGISCPSGARACPSASFLQGTHVTLTATPASGSVFNGWSGDCSGQTCEVPIDRDTSVAATFERENRVHALSVSKEGKGGGTVRSQPVGVECGSLCSAWFLRGTPVMLSAQATVGSSFGGWSGSCRGTGTCFVAMNEDESVTASFTVGPAETALAQDISETVVKLAELAQNSVFGLAFHASQPGILTIALYGTSASAKLARVRSAEPIPVAVGRHAFAGAGTARIEIKLTPAGRTLLKHAKRLTLTAKGIFKSHGEAAIETTERFVTHLAQEHTHSRPKPSMHPRPKPPSKLEQSEPVEGVSK